MVIDRSVMAVWEGRRSEKSRGVERYEREGRVRNGKKNKEE